MSVNHSAMSDGIIGISLRYRGDSNEYTQYTILNMKKKITLNYPKFAAMGFFQGTQERVRSESSVFEPLKFCCMVQPSTKTSNLSSEMIKLKLMRVFWRIQVLNRSFEDGKLSHICYITSNICHKLIHVFTYTYTKSI